MEFPVQRHRGLFYQEAEHEGQLLLILPCLLCPQQGQKLAGRMGRSHQRLSQKFFTNCHFTLVIITKLISKLILVEHFPYPKIWVHVCLPCLIVEDNETHRSKYHPRPYRHELTVSGYEFRSVQPWQYCQSANFPTSKRQTCPGLENKTSAQLYLLTVLQKNFTKIFFFIRKVV